jgi:thymidylate synthase
MNNIDKQYQSLLQDILDNGVEKKDRTGTGTISVFGRQIRHKMSEGFPLLTTKKMAWKTMVTELLWFLRGDTNIKFLHDNGCHIWDGDYAKSGRTDGELGPIYGAQWRKWNGPYDDGFGESIDQIANLINDLKTNPDSRRLMVNAWNVGELDQMVLPPCHFSFQCYSHEKEGKRYLSLAWNQRSIDFGLGLPFNIASYGLLLEIIAKEVGMIPYELIGNLGDCHIYNNHIDGLKEQLTREPYPLPKICLDYREGEYNKDLTDLTSDDFVLFYYQSHPTIKLPLSN